jgi:hypothetical protein
VLTCCVALSIGHRVHRGRCGTGQRP